MTTCPTGLRTTLIAISACALGVVATASAQPPVAVDVGSAWNGLARAGAFTELLVTLSSPKQVDVDVTIDGTGPVRLPVQTSVALKPGAPRTVALPYRVSTDRPIADPVEVHVRTGDGDSWTHAARIFTAAPVAPLVAFPIAPGLRAAAGSAITADAVPVFVGADEMPRIAQGYGPIAGLIIDSSILTALDRDQLAAFQGYLADCGRVVAVRLPNAVIPRFRRIAGCGGQALAVVGTPMAAGPAMSGLLSVDVSEETTPWPLGFVRPFVGSEPVGLIVFLGGYFLVLALAAAVARRTWPVVGVPLTATLLVILIWHDRRPETQLTAWSETTSGQETLRYRALLQVRGRGRGEADLPLPRNIEVEALTGTPDARLVASTEAGDGDRLVMPTRLFSSSVVRMSGTETLSARATLTLDRGFPAIKNTGSEPLSGTVLILDGRHATLPTIAPDSMWSGDSDEIAALPTAEHDSLPAATVDGLLVPYVPANLAVTPAHTQTGWLLIHPGTSDAGGTR